MTLDEYLAQDKYFSESAQELLDLDDMNPIYPNITVRLVGEDGNAFNLIGKVAKALRENGIAKKEVTKFQNEAMSGDYDGVIQTCMKWVTVT